MHELSKRDRDILTFARSWYAFRGNHEAAVRDQFNMTTTTFFQHLNRVIDLPGAMAFDPFTTKRLQRLRADRRRSQSARQA